jgi:hypothetical protein
VRVDFVLLPYDHLQHWYPPVKLYLQKEEINIGRLKRIVTITAIPWRKDLLLLKICVFLVGLAM